VRPSWDHSYVPHWTSFSCPSVPMPTHVTVTVRPHVASTAGTAHWPEAVTKEAPGPLSTSPDQFAVVIAGCEAEWTGAAGAAAAADAADAPEAATRLQTKTAIAQATPGMCPRRGAPFLGATPWLPPSNPFGRPAGRSARAAPH